MAYLRNCWYVAALSKEVQASKIFTRKILDENILFFRDQTGLATAMADRCPHRFAQLSMGKLQDDCIQCPYHGLTFNQQGQCVHNPHGDGRIPDKAKVKVFPVVERYSAIWIWMGEPALANPKTIPSCDFLDSENFYIGSDYMNIQGNYLLESDNILDLSHIEFVHPLFSSPSVSAGEYKCEVEGNTIWSKRDIYNDSQAPEFIHKVFRIPQGTVIDRWLHVHWQAPAIMALYSGGVASGKNRSEGVETPGFHWFTPETETSSHYFFGISFPKAMGEEFEKIAAEEIKQLRAPFEFEDKPIIESQQRNIGNKDFWDERPLILNIDAAGTKARRIMQKMIDEENA